MQEDVPVSLDAPLAEGTHEITARFLQPSGDPYPEDHTRTATVTLEGTQPVVFQITDLTPQTAEVEATEASHSLAATISNVGEGSATKDVGLELQGSVQETESVTLDGRARTTLQFTLNLSSLDPGETATFSVSTPDESASGTVDVAMPPPTTEADTETTPGNDGDVSTEDGPGFDVGGAIVAVLAAMGLASRYADAE